MNVTVAATQMACSWNLDENIARAESLVHEAANAGANIILLQELFETPYFPIEQDHAHFKLASPMDESRAVGHFRALAKKLNVVLPISFFERAGQAFFNTVAIVDATGEIVGQYRKSHIPNDVCYQEKSYFSPGDTGFKVWSTVFGRIGVGICWDQWFPEAARSMALQGAEILFYPTAIGNDLELIDGDSSKHWRTCMQGHSAANIVPVVASNRIGIEKAASDPSLAINFYGTSFITDHTGQIAADAGEGQQAVITHTLDLAECQRYRSYWSVFRDRRPDLYKNILTLDGTTA